MSDDQRDDEYIEEAETGADPVPAPAADGRSEDARAQEAAGRSPMTSEPADQIPSNILDQTREGEHPYQWHEGVNREHGSTDAVEFIDVKKSFGRNTVLNGLNFGIPEGQISMIIGPSGTGKSVCIKHMVGLLYPDEGDVLVHGESVPNMADDDLFEMRKKFGVLFQDGALFGSMNVFDNVAFPLRQHTDKGEDEIAEICNRRLREVGLSGALDKMPNELSGGMRKRAGFARALVLDPQIVLFDEEEQPVTTEDCPSGDPTCEQEIGIPNEAQRIDVAGDLLTPFNFGWAYLNLQHLDTAYGDPFAQTWVTTTMDAEGRFSVGFDAIQLDNANAPTTIFIGGVL